MANKADRLREFLRERKESPLVPPPSRAQWDLILEEADLTPDDLKLLARQVSGHQARARKAQAEGDEETLVFEATQALSLDPFQEAFVAEVSTWLKSPAALTPELEVLKRRVNSQKTGLLSPPWWFWLGCAAVLATIVTGLVVWQPWNTPAVSVAPVIKAESRSIAVEWSTSSVKADVLVRKSVLEVYAESKVLDVDAIVVFPNDRVGLWVVEVVAVDALGNTVFRTERELHSAAEGSLEPNLGLPVSMQFDAAVWKGEVAALKINTLQLDATGAAALEKVLVAVANTGSLPKGYGLSVSQISSTWKTRFATRAGLLVLELRNTGLKPFRSLKFVIEWRDGQGQLLKSSTWNPISEFRTELISGAHLSAEIETVFETELFPWSPGQEPKPSLRLESWK